MSDIHLFKKYVCTYINKETCIYKSKSFRKNTYGDGKQMREAFLEQEGREAQQQNWVDVAVSSPIRILFMMLPNWTIFSRIFFRCLESSKYEHMIRIA